MDEKEPEPKRTQIMTLKEVAKYLGVHPITIYKLIKNSGMPALKLGGQWRFKKDILDEWLVTQMGKGRLAPRKRWR